MVVALGYNGKADIHRGLVKPEDRVKGAEKETLGVDGEGSAARKAERDEANGGLSAALVESLSAHKGTALAAELLNKPEIALRAVVHGLAASLLFGSLEGDLPLKLRPTGAGYRRVEGSAALTAIERAREFWANKLGIDEDAEDAQARLWAWCTDAERTVPDLLELLALCAALTVDTVRLPFGGWEEAAAQAERIAQTAGLNMAAYFTPTAENFFGRVSKPTILAALREAKPESAAHDAWAKLKKGALADMAETELKGSNWLPEILRVGA